MPTSTTPAPLVYLDKTATKEEITKVLRRDGAVVVKNVVEPALMSKLAFELEPGFAADRAAKARTKGDNYKESFPVQTERTDLIGVSTVADELLLHPTVTGAFRGLLYDTYPFYVGDDLHEPTSDMQLAASVAIRCGPGTPAQGIHRDDSFAHTRHPSDHEDTCTAIWAVSPATAENGATDAIIGSGAWDDKIRPLEFKNQIVQAEMTVGSVLLITGSIYHAGGHNRSTDDTRLVAVFFYCRDYLRQSQNQYLNVSRDMLRTKSVAVQEMLGYAVSKPGAGYYNGRDPKLYLRDPGEDVSDLPTSWYD